jgi:hypothetical protein
VRREVRAIRTTSATVVSRYPFSMIASAIAAISRWRASGMTGNGS